MKRSPRLSLFRADREESPAPASLSAGTTESAYAEVAASVLAALLVAIVVVFLVEDPSETRFLAVALVALVVVATLVPPFPRAGVLVALLAVLGYAALQLSLAIQAGAGAEGRHIVRAALGAACFVAGFTSAGWVERALRSLRDEIATQRMMIDDLAQRDETTGAIKAEHALRRITDEIGRARRYGYPVSLILLAIEAETEDEKLPVEERQARLAKIGQSLQTGVRPHDSVGHYGRGRFLVVLPHTPLNGALVVETKLRSRVVEASGVALRAGVVEFPEDAATVDDLLAEAEHALEFARAANLGVASRSLFS